MMAKRMSEDSLLPNSLRFEEEETADMELKPTQLIENSKVPREKEKEPVTRLDVERQRKESLLKDENLVGVKSLRLTKLQPVFAITTDPIDSRSKAVISLTSISPELTFGKNGVPAKEDLSADVLFTLIRSIQSGVLVDSTNGVKTEDKYNFPRTASLVKGGADPVLASGMSSSDLMKTLRPPSDTSDPNDPAPLVDPDYGTKLVASIKAKYGKKVEVLVALKYMEECTLRRSWLLRELENMRIQSAVEKAA